MAAQKLQELCKIEKRGKFALIIKRLNILEKTPKKFLTG
jgi:hypothetical protein